MGESVSDMLANTADWSVEVCDAIIGLVGLLEDRFEGEKDPVWEHLVLIQEGIEKSRTT